MSFDMTAHSQARVILTMTTTSPPAIGGDAQRVPYCTQLFVTTNTSAPS